MRLPLIELSLFTSAGGWYVGTFAGGHSFPLKGPFRTKAEAVKAMRAIRSRFHKTCLPNLRSPHEQTDAYKALRVLKAALDSAGQIANS